MINEKEIRKYCCDDLSMIENYEKAISDNLIWHCHHRLEIHGNVILSMDELKKLDLYYNRPAYELIFLTRPDHIALHRKAYSWNRGKTNVYSQKSLSMMSNAKKGKVFSEEHRQNLSKAHKDKPLPKNKWKTPDGDIIEMAKNNVMRFHKDWVLVE